MVTEQQYQRLMKEYVKSGVLGTAAMKAGMHRETAAKYVAAGQGPQPEKRRGRRRPDPLTTIWASAERLLNDAPELEAKALFEHLLAGGAAPEAQNALLKTLEEPPPRTYLLLLTTRLDRLLPTIRSRCQQVSLGPLDAPSMQAWLHGTPLRATGPELEWLLRFAEGSPGAAVMAERERLFEWWSDFQQGFADLDAGRLPEGLSERMHDRAAELAEGVVKQNEHASKEAANRLASEALSVLLLITGLLSALAIFFMSGINRALFAGYIDDPRTFQLC